MQRTGGRGCRDLILSLPNTPTLDTFNSGTAWPRHSAWEGGEREGSTGRRREEAQPSRGGGRRMRAAAGIISA